MWILYMSAKLGYSHAYPNNLKQKEQAIIHQLVNPWFKDISHYPIFHKNEHNCSNTNEFQMLEIFKLLIISYLYIWYGCCN
jgi:hypothetical protein